MTRHEYADALLKIAKKRAELEDESNEVRAVYIAANCEFKVGDRATISGARGARTVQVIGHRVERGEIIPRFRKVRKNGDVGEVSDHVYPGEEIHPVERKFLK